MTEYFDPKTPELAVGVFGLDFVKRGANDNHTCIKLFAEDDGHYWETNNFSSYWIDTLITILQEAREELNNKDRFTPDGKWGYKFKNS